MKIAIIDTGINEKHIAFKNNFKISQCICIRKNVDERYFISEDVEDYIGHGTSVSWIISNYITDAEFMIIKIFDKEELDEDILLYTLQYIIDHVECDLINLSAGISYCDNINLLKELCEKLYSRGTLIIAGFPNDGALGYPASFDSVIGVDMSTSCFFPRQYQYIENSPINIRGIGHAQRLPDVNNTYCEKLGTSFVVPHITGLIAEKFSKKKWNIVEVKNFLKQSANCVVEGRVIPKNNIINIKNAVLFPVSKETKALIEFSDMLSFNITHIYDIKYSGNVGKGIRNYDQYHEINSDLIIESIDSINWLDDFDTLIIGHINMIGKALGNRNIKEELLKKCEEYKKQVYMYDFIDYDAKKYKNLKLKVPHVDSSCVLNAVYGKLFKIAIPIVGVFGTSPKQGKFTIQLRLKKYLTEIGYKVCNLGTEPESELFGFEGTYPIGYNATVKVSGYEAITYLNSLMHSIELKEPDLIIVGAQSQTIPTGNECLGCFPVAQHELILGSQPDAYILCVNCTDEINYIMNTMKYLQILTDAKIVSIVVFPLIYQNVEGVLTKVKAKMGEENLKNFIRILSGKVQTPVYSMDDEKLIEKIAKDITDFFT